MDLNALLHGHQLSLMNADRSLTPSEKQVHDRFVRDLAEEIGVRRDALGAPTAPLGSVT